MKVNTPTQICPTDSLQKVQKQFDEERAFSKNGAGTIEHAEAKNEPQPKPSPYAEINSKWITDKCKTQNSKMSRENHRSKFGGDLQVVKELLNLTPESP